MGRGLNQLAGLRDDAIDYARLKWASLRLATVDKLSEGLSKALSYAVFGILLIFALMFLAVALALWVGEMLGNYSYGFLIVGGGALVLAVIVLLIGGRLVQNSLVRYFINMFFDKNGEDHGTTC